MKNLTGMIGPKTLSKVVVTDTDGDEHVLEDVTSAVVRDQQGFGQPRDRLLTIVIRIPE